MIPFRPIQLGTKDFHSEGPDIIACPIEAHWPRPEDWGKGIWSVFSMWNLARIPERTFGEYEEREEHGPPMIC